jgi:hypothetical protein
MVQRALNAAPSQTTIALTSVYDPTTRRRTRSFQVTRSLLRNDGVFVQETLDELWPYFDAYGRWRYRLYRPEPTWANIGPIVKGDRSLLDHSLTHNSDGIPLFPAVDLAWGVGIAMIAPEACVVDTKDTSANPGEALYLTGASRLRYWLAHLDRDHPLGARFAKGALLGRTINQAGADHGHVGVNGEAYLGKGRQFLYGRNGNGPDYTVGAPTLRHQLTDALA